MPIRLAQVQKCEKEENSRDISRKNRERERKKRNKKSECWTQWKCCCRLLELSVWFSCLPFCFGLLLIFFFNFVFLFTRFVRLHRSVFFLYLTIMMRQLFKSRHIHALVKRPRFIHGTIMITKSNITNNLVRNRPRGRSAQGRNDAEMEWNGGKNELRTKNLMLKYLSA